MVDGVHEARGRNNSVGYRAQESSKEPELERASLVCRRTSEVKLAKHTLLAEPRPASIEETWGTPVVIFFA